MGYSYLNIESINKRALSSKKAKAAAFRKADKKLRIEKNILIEEFKNHPVTEEITAGYDAKNTSGLLGGYGNLFSFIGFSKGTDPISPILDLLKNLIKTKNFKRLSGSNYQFTYQYPTQKEIASSSRSPYLSGKSWIDGIENGFGNFAYYIYNTFIKNSRSSTGLQIKNKLRATDQRTTPYLSEMIDKFKNNVSK